MATKTLSVTKDVYDILKRMKLEGESFSDTIRRLARRGSLADCAGLWSDMPEEEFGKFLKAIGEARTKATKDLAERSESP